MSPHPHAKTLKNAAMQSETMGKAKHASGAVLTEVAIASVKGALKQHSVKGAINGARSAVHDQVKAFIGGDEDASSTSSSDSASPKQTAKPEENSPSDPKRPPREARQSSEGHDTVGTAVTSPDYMQQLPPAMHGRGSTRRGNNIPGDERYAPYAAPKDASYVAERVAAERAAAYAADREAAVAAKDPFRSLVYQNPHHPFSQPLSPRYRQPSSFLRQDPWENSLSSSFDSAGSFGPIVGYRPPAYDTESGLSPADDAIYGRPKTFAKGMGKDSGSSPGSSHDGASAGDGGSTTNASKDGHQAVDARYRRPPFSTGPGQSYSAWRNSSPAGSLDSGSGSGRGNYLSLSSTHHVPGSNLGGMQMPIGASYRGGLQSNSPLAYGSGYAGRFVTSRQYSSVRRNPGSSVGSSISSGYRASSLASPYIGQGTMAGRSSADGLGSGSSNGSLAGHVTQPLQYSAGGALGHGSAAGSARSEARPLDGMGGTGGMQRQQPTSDVHYGGSGHVTGTGSSYAPSAGSDRASSVVPIGSRSGYAGNLVASTHRSRLSGKSYTGTQYRPGVGTSPSSSLAIGNPSYSYPKGPSPSTGYLEGSEIGSSVTAPASGSSSSFRYQVPSQASFEHARRSPIHDSFLYP